MKNRYCMFCGTLLPEDGVCLRCGAKYRLADDGQLKVIPRKVKKVSVKTTPKKRFTVKTKQESSEAETKTIPIPEDVFSFSDDAKREDMHTDWTGDSEPDYVPNFVLKDEKEQAYRQYSNANKEGAHKNQAHENNNPRPKQKPLGSGALIAIFLIIAIVSALASYFFLGNHQRDIKDNESPSSQEEKPNGFQISGDSKALYAEVLDAYKEYETSGYRPVSNEYVNSDLYYGEPDVENYWDYMWIRVNERIAYAFWDINNDGVEELFVGRTNDRGEYFSIIDVYTFKNAPTRVFPDFGFVGPGSVMHFYEDGSIAETPEQQDGPSDKRVKEQGYTFYELKKGDATATQIKAYWITTLLDTSGTEYFKAYKRENGSEAEVSLEEYGKIDDMYGGAWLENMPEYSAKWNNNNQVVKEKVFNWHYLINHSALSGLSEENKKAVAAYKQFVFGLYYERNAGYGDEAKELDEMKRYLIELLNNFDDQEEMSVLAEELEFSVCDVNNDDVLDFAIRSRIGPTVAHKSVLYNYSGNSNEVVNVLEGYDLEYYPNGNVAVLWGHNQTKGDLWPRTYYQQNKPKQGYNDFGQVYAWSRANIEEGFPYSADKDNNGIVYTFDMDNTWVDDSAYQAWLKRYGVENPKAFDWYTFSLDNIRQFETIAAKAS